MAIFTRCLAMGASMTLAAGLTFAQGTGAATEQANVPQREQPNDCVTQAAIYQGVDPWIVRAILKVESNFNSKALNKNRNGTVDVGMAQINSMHFKELRQYGIVPVDLLDGCISSYVAAWHLKKQVLSYGNTWFAVGAYHSATPCFNRRYSGLVWNALIGWGAIAGTRVPVASMASCDTKGTAHAKAGTSVARASVMAVDIE